MLNKVCLWVRKYLRLIILAISIGVSIAVLGFILTEYGIILRTPELLLYSWTILVLSAMTAIISCIWYKIPCTRIQQSKKPDKWISAEIKCIDNSQYLMQCEPQYIDFVEMVIELKSDLPFDVKLNSIGGRAISNGRETNSMLFNSPSIELPKNGRKIIKEWRLYGWTDCIKDFLGLPEETKIVIKLELSGEDNKCRKYKLTTADFNYRI